MKYGYRKLYVDGDLRDAAGGRRREVICPATEEAIGEVAWADATDATAALEAARRGFSLWRATSIGERMATMARLRKLVAEHEESLRECVMDEHGKTYEQAEEDWFTLVDALDYYAAEMRSRTGEVIPDLDGLHEHRFVWEPAGVVCAFLAWNFPLLNLAFKLAPALAAGCSIIVRPSSHTPISTYIVGELCSQAGVPPGVVNILSGPIDTMADTLVQSDVPALLTLIGSSETGRRIMARGAQSIKRYSMELGGNAPVLVFADSDVDSAASTVAALKFSNSGQICVTPNRVYVQRPVYEEFLKRLRGHTEGVVMGHGRDSGATMGPLISAAARDRVASWVNSAVREGARLVIGGTLDGIPERGYYYPATVLADVRDDMTVSCEEVFGPVVNVSPFDEETEALNRANATTAGLTAYLFSDSLDRVHRLASELRFGEVQVNGVRYGVGLPHGGIKQSGMGHDASRHAFDDYLTRKRITVARR